MRLRMYLNAVTKIAGIKAATLGADTGLTSDGQEPGGNGLTFDYDEGGADGFMLIATYTPGCFEEFVDLVVPELQRRGRFRTKYTGTTLRDHLLEY